MMKISDLYVKYLYEIEANGRRLNILPQLQKTICLGKPSKTANNVWAYSLPKVYRRADQSEKGRNQ